MKNESYFKILKNYQLFRKGDVHKLKEYYDSSTGKYYYELKKELYKNIMIPEEFVKEIPIEVNPEYYL